MEHLSYAVSPADVAAAAGRIAPYLHETPVLTSSHLSQLASAGAASGPRTLFFKAELFQKTGSFKARGATNAVMQLSDAAAEKGVVTHSSGNHAAALAAAAAFRGVPAYIVMPESAPPIKRLAVEGYGGRVTTSGNTAEAREAVCADVSAITGAAFIHPSEDPHVIAGQGTLGLELLRQVAAMGAGGGPPSSEEEGPPILDAVIVPIGGGGLISGVAIAIHGVDPRIRIIAAEPSAADDAYRSLQAGRILTHDGVAVVTIADGLKTHLGPNTWPIVRDHVERVVRVSEGDIAAAMRLVYERMKVVIEPSAAVGVAASLSDEVRALPGLRRVGIVLCGGNADVTALPFVGGFR